MWENGKMDRESIERLAIDSAAGQLNEDAEALLKEYLAEHSQAGEWFTDIKEIYDNTQAVFDTKTAPAKTESKPAQKIYRLPVVRRAAIIIFAVFLGAAAGRWSNSPSPVEKPGRITAYHDPDTSKMSLNPDDIGESFWRRKAVAMITSSSGIKKDHVTGPKLWEKYRQFIKEKNYE